MSNHLAFSTKQYVWIASVFRDLRRKAIAIDDLGYERTSVEEVTRGFADALASAHENFDRERFMKDVYNGEAQS